MGLRWQRRPEKRWLANLLANEQTVKSLLGYLMNTEVGVEKDKAAEWDQRVDQEGGRNCLTAGNPCIKRQNREGR